LEIFLHLDFVRAKVYEDDIQSLKNILLYPDFIKEKSSLWKISKIEKRKPKVVIIS
jgi:hypothetical protein